MSDKTVELPKPVEAGLDDKDLEGVSGGATVAHPDFDWRKAGLTGPTATTALDPKIVTKL